LILQPHTRSKILFFSAEQLSSTLQHTVEGVLGRIASVEGQQHLNSSNNTALVGEVQVFDPAAVFFAAKHTLTLRAAARADHQTDSNRTGSFLCEGSRRWPARQRGSAGEHQRVGRPQSHAGWCVLRSLFKETLNSFCYQCMKAIELVDAGECA
jgi:hypothetical protein